MTINESATTLEYPQAPLEFSALKPDSVEALLQRPVDLETYLDYQGLLGTGFGYGELVRRYGNRHEHPPRSMWRDFASVLMAAIEFRKWAIDMAGVRGLKVAAAYRPTGGARNSAHKKARALDLDRIGGDAREYFKTAVRFWCEHGYAHKSGLGLYTWSRWNKGGIRVHLDVGHGCRSWQGVSLGPSFQRPYKIKGEDGRWYQLGLAPKIASDLNLDVPSLSYL